MNEENILNLLYRTEESESKKDSTGNFESQHCERRWEAPLYYPTINKEIVRRDPHWLDEIHWPQGKTFAACLTHDVDTVRINSRRELVRTIQLHMNAEPNMSQRFKHAFSFIGLRKRPPKVDIFTPWIDLERQFGFHSSFFFFAESISQRHFRDNVYKWNDPTYYKNKIVSVKDVVRDICSQGWEIGLHGSYLSASSLDLLVEQKNDLERILGEQIYTTRQHNLHYDAGITPIVQDAAGFQADSTLGFNRDIGFRAGIAYPFRTWDQSEHRWLGTLQVPLNLQDGAILRNDNLDLDEETAFLICKRLIDRVIVTKGVITLLWHPDTLVKTSWWKVYERLLRYIYEQNGWGASLKEIHDWWIGQGLCEKLEARLNDLRENPGTR